MTTTTTASLPVLTGGAVTLPESSPAGLSQDVSTERDAAQLSRMQMVSSTAPRLALLRRSRA